MTIDKKFFEIIFKKFKGKKIKQYLIFKNYLQR